MSEYKRKFDAAMAELQNTDMWNTNHTPPLLRTLLAMGIEARPPHYANLWVVFCGFAVWFAVSWGVAMWFISWRTAGFSGWDAMGASVFAGVLFGTFMTAFYWRGRKKHGLTRWADL